MLLSTNIRNQLFKNIRFILFSFFLLLIHGDPLAAQCPAGSTEVTVSYTTGAFDNENSWVLYDATNGVSLACYEESQQGANTQTACVPDNAQIELITYESFGDGWNNSTITVSISDDGSGGSTCTNVTDIFSSLSPLNGGGSPTSPGSVPQGAITSCPPSSIPVNSSCQNSFSIDNACTVTGSTPPNIGPNSPICVGDVFLLTGGPVGYTWTGPFVTDNGDGTGTFSSSFPGLFDVFLTDGSGCSVLNMIEVMGVNPETGANTNTFCTTSDPIILGPIDPGVTWTGPGVSLNADGSYTFDPSVAGIGGHTAVFNYLSADCDYDLNFFFQVNDDTPPDPGTYGPVCVTDGTIMLSGTPLSTNSFWFGPGITDNGDGTAIFDPSGFGGNSTITVTYGINGGCSSTTDIEVIGGEPFVPIYDDRCVDSFDFTLFANPTGGVWTGVGVIDNGDGTYDFSSSTAGIGTHTLTYTFQEPTNTCPPVSVTTDITVIENTLDPGTYGPLCGADAPITLMGNPLDPNAFWFGFGVTDNGDGTATFKWNCNI